MADIIIDIASEFTGKKAFKQAENSTEALMKNVKKLAKTLGVAYGSQQILAFAKSSVRAAASDQKAQQQLALALKNVGLERDAASAEGFIQRLQSEFGIVDDLLRPAYQSLAIAVRSSAEAQRLLNLSLDISAATGKDLGSVTAALSKAYLGNNTALTRLGVGISKADLKTKSFYEVTTQLADTFKGSAASAAATFQGSMDKLAVASNNVKEIIGTGIIDALTNLGNDNSVSDLAKSMEDAALFTADLIRGVGVLTEKLKAIPGVSGLKLGMIPVVGSYLEGLSGLGKQSRIAPKPFSTGMSVSGQTQTKAVSGTQTKIAKETLKINKESLKLAKARATFDLQKIQIEAALKGKLSEEDAIRLKLMKAIEDENVAAAEKYQKALDESQKKTAELAALLATVKAMEIKDPFSTWSIDPLTASINALTTSIGGVGTAITASGKEWSSFTGTVATTVIQPNLKEFSSSFAMAIDGALSAIATGSEGLKSLADTATKAIGSTTTSTTDTTVLAIATSGAATADTIVETSQAAADALDKLYSDSNNALTNATTSTVVDFMATSSASLANLRDVLAAEAAAYATAAAAASAQAAADAADLAGAGNASSGNTVTVTVQGSVISQNDLAAFVTDAVNSASSAGNAVGYNRTATIMSTQ